MIKKKIKIPIIKKTWPVFLASLHAPVWVLRGKAGQWPHPVGEGPGRQNWAWWKTAPFQGGDWEGQARYLFWKTTQLHWRPSRKISVPRLMSHSTNVQSHDFYSRAVWGIICKLTAWAPHHLWRKALTLISIPHSSRYSKSTYPPPSGLVCLLFFFLWVLFLALKILI